MKTKKELEQLALESYLKDDLTNPDDQYNHRRGFIFGYQMAESSFKLLEPGVKEAIKNNRGITKVAIESNVSRKQIGLITNKGKFNKATLDRLCDYFNLELYVK